MKSLQNRWLACAAVAAAYGITGKLGFLAAIEPGNVTTVWPPSGIALAMVLRLGPRLWPGIWLGSFIVNLWFFADRGPLTPASLGTSALIGVGSTLQALAGALFLRRLTGGREPFERPGDVFRFAAAAPVACVVASTWGVAALCGAGFVPWSAYAYTWTTWWFGDLAGVILVAPAILAAELLPPFLRDARRSAEAVLLAGLLLLAVGIVFGPWTVVGLRRLPVGFTLLPFVVWSACRFGPGGISACLLAIAAAAVAGTVQGYGHFAVGGLNTSLLLLQSFLVIIAVTGLALAAAVGEMRRTEAVLRDAHDGQERLVLERTVELADANTALRLEVELRRKAEEDLCAGEASLRRLNRDLAAANREMEAFAYSASHDLRAPVRRMDGFLRILEEDHATALGEVGLRHLGRVRASCEQMARLIDDLFRLSQVSREELIREPVDLSGAALSILDELRRENPLRIVKTVITEGMTADGDPRLLRLALENLLGNAWKFTSKNPAATIHVGMERRDGGTVYFVRDDGAGFDSAQVHRLFAPFQRLHDSAEYPGSGVGLATVQRIVHRHGGRIWAEGETGKGAAFYFTLSPGPAPPPTGVAG